MSKGNRNLSGHSKWHNIRLRKGAQDAKRGNLFTKLAKEIIMAAKSGGNPEVNLRLRLAIAKAKDNSMPADNIKRSIQRGTGEIAGAVFEEVSYEGYGPGGTAVIVECATDNRNRTAGNIRNIFNKNGGRMGESGSVSYRFQAVGLIAVKKSVTDEDTLFNVVLEAGAEDVRTDDPDNFEVVTPPETFGAVREAIEAANIPFISADFTLEPTDSVTLDAKDTALLFRMLDKFDDDDDVQKVHANFDASEEDVAAAM